MNDPNYPTSGGQPGQGWPGGQPTQPGGQPTQPGAPYGYVAGGYPPQFYVQPRKTNGLALAAMITSICSVVMCPLVGIVGAIMGHKARAQVRQTGEEGEGFALAGIIVGWISFGFLVVILLIYGIIIAIAAANGAFESALV
jgi:hypothetical protein